MTNIIEWDEKYSVNVPELDECRKQLMDMFNTLIEMKANKGDAKNVANLVTEINDFSKIFFSKEEKILGRNGYPDLVTHSKAHRRFIKNAIGLRREIAEDVDNLSIEDIVELRGLLVTHFESVDTLFIPFLRIHKYVDECENKK
ncbi:chemotaxis protein [Desulfobacter hydrogenophilus]|uniref:Chemotaxis protein n=1 Tax=Desulfobacter hydrogenophilus TaxID=2291 RepID=A0A328FF95_9BACT|nr:hemerythrin domain-containing protein [Desulfobacter hydrogenophilus]NDY70486.1 chemotaxis protein [Desulfobacter hydrogenophilus]QBH13863.1 chemotaxis protein [Desulfobacter hydrogenophilus]RAM02092.1 chemotaxis protein [Desulfobacter hydrogenophilus]